MCHAVLDFLFDCCDAPVMRTFVREGQRCADRCPVPGCQQSDVWITSVRDWETRRRILLHCSAGHLLYWYPDGKPARLGEDSENLRAG